MGATELEKGPASETKLDVLPGFRNTVLRTKQVIIGCGGGLHQECTQPVLLVQTRVGFLSGGRGKSFHQLPPQEQAAQREEAYARATVALTRAQQICFIMGPLDMRGLVGAATIIGLKYGAWFSGLDDQDDPVFLIRLEAPDDSAFLQS